MIQKNRIMTKKGIIIFDRNIDVEKTQENGKRYVKPMHLLFNREFD